MFSQSEVESFVESTKQHATLPDSDNFDGAFDTALEQNYPGCRTRMISYAGEHQEDEIFEVDGKLVAWINWHFHIWYVLPANKEKD